MNAMAPLRPGALAAAGLVVSLAAVAAAALSGFGYRWEWWSFRQGFTLLRWATYCGLAGAALSLLGGLIARAAGGRAVLACALVGVIAGLGLFSWSWRLSRAARAVPAIHDISTDTERPPAFSAILPLRAGAANPSEYGGAEVARLQHQEYPDIRPLILTVDPGQAFERALDAVRRLRWTLVAEDRPAGRIEAYDRTLWYGFIDDVVIRVAPEGSGSRIDVRSVSRVGRSDIGTNARRIRRFLASVSLGR